MTERIRELADQCQIEEYNQFGDLVEFGFDAEKFAELMIKEMLDVQRQLKIAGVEHGSDMDQTILVYFGVEE
jgi:hypothetical protein